jgi:uncharacterized membrane protein
MTQNESETDRLVRAVLGVLLILVGVSVSEGLWQIILFVFGGVLVVTALTGFCLIYKLLGISTMKKE